MSRKKEPQSKQSNKNKNKLKDSFIDKNPRYWSMSHAPALGTEAHWFQMIPVIIFTAFIIMIVRMANYTAPMKGYYWHTDATQFADFFSYYKSVAIIMTAGLALCIILYKITTQAFAVKKTALYIPMAVYSFFVLLSYIFSDYKYFALRGYLDRFEGTVVLLCYMLMLFYIINTVNTERHVKWILNSLGISSSILGILGITQFMNHDFFKTTIGKKFITPPSYWPNIDNLKFSFTTEIYQTVYNINYVSFYLTLLIPIAALLFVSEKNIRKKIIYGAVSALLVFNIVGSKSSSGILGLCIAFIIGLIILNKNLLKWWKSIAVVLGSIVIVLVLTFNVIAPELMDAIKNALAKEGTYSPISQRIDYMDTDYDKLTISCNNEPVTIVADLKNPELGKFEIYDKNHKLLTTSRVSGEKSYVIDDSRFKMYEFSYVESDKEYYLVVKIETTTWPFQITKKGIFYYNRIHKLVDLDRVPSIGFKNHESFGSGRGYIWSRSIPLLKDRILIGSGADTYCLVFPHNDYVGKLNAPGWTEKTHIIVDKPHNMYLQAGINTGIVSLLALLALFFGYIAWCFKIYMRRDLNDFASIAGVGIFIGICGFLAAAVFNDSSVSVAPMFWGLLGTGIAINFMLDKTEAKTE